MSGNKQTILIPLLLTVVGLTIGIFWGINKSGNDPLKELAKENAKPLENPRTFDGVKNIPAGVFNYGGSTTWAPIRAVVDSQIQTEVPQFRLNYTAPKSGNAGSSTGIKMLLQGELTFAQSSRPLSEEEHQFALKKGFALKQIPVAIDNIAVAVHPDLKIPGLTLAQLKDIYLGRFTNWNQLNGPDLAIIPHSRYPSEGGTVDFFRENVLEGDRFGDNVVFISDTELALNEIARIPGGIYYASAIQIVGQCHVRPLPLGRTMNSLIAPYREPFIDLSLCSKERNQLNKRAFSSGDYALTRRLFVIVKQNGQEEELAGNAYAQMLLTARGQALIEETGFIGLHPQSR